MKKLLTLAIFLFTIRSFAQIDTRENYTKMQANITMRDGVKLFTNIYIPKDASTTNSYPILMNRTCYSIGYYGKDEMPEVMHSPSFTKEKFIFVEQDVRGRYMSEGTWTNMTPQVNPKTKPTDVDESSDTYDTIDWLIKNVPNNNGRVGIHGISYPGFYTVVGALSGHPALKAVSPQAPVTDFFFEDFHHNGAFTLGYGLTFPVFGVQNPQPTADNWFNFQFPEIKTKDGFEWYKSMQPLSKFSEQYKDNFFWNEIVQHPNYDDYWKKRNTLPHLKAAKNLPAFMTVGGWFDAEDLFGPLNVYQTIEKAHPDTYNTIVMGPFGHGDWARESGHHFHSNVYFGDSISTFYQSQIELKFFKHFLKGSGDKNSGLPDAYMFDTGKKEWKTFEEYPSKNVEKITFYLNPNGKLDKSAAKGAAEYISDPKKPVPYTEDPDQILGFSPRRYMSEDQRFASRRTDVLTFETDELSEDITLTGCIMTHLKITTTGTDADYFVKLIDVYPDDKPNSEFANNCTTYGGYQQMVRSEVLRARFRNSFSEPSPLKANTLTNIDFKLQDVLHTFKKGHKIMVQVQSTAFPLFDINPQKYVPNIYQAKESDFIKATHRVFGTSSIEVMRMKE